MVATGGMNLYPCNRFEQSLEYRKCQEKIVALEQRVKEQADKYLELIAQLHRDVVERNMEIKRLRDLMDAEL